MTSVYENAKQETLRALNELNSREDINAALSVTLPNTSEETDYAGWIEGSKKFAADNESVLREWMG